MPHESRPGRGGRLACCALLAGLAMPGAARAEGPTLRSPVDCALGETCFVQQLPDMDPGPGATDPFCGPRSYDGHKGTDIRVRSMADLARSPVPVVAMAPGTVRAVRDGMADALLTRPGEAAALDGRDCGNGLVVEHAEGWTSQYCHMARGSIDRTAGERVEAGDALGLMGASGNTQFPHVHVTLRRGETEIDPVTGRALADGCTLSGAGTQPLWDAAMMEAIAPARTVLGVGLAGVVPDTGTMRIEGAPPSAETASPLAVGWLWAINLRAGDRIRVRLTAPDGTVATDSLSDPLERDRAVHVAFAGSRGAPAAGEWRVEASVVSDGEVTLEDAVTVRVE